MHSTSRVLVCIVQLCFKNKDWNALNEHIVILTKRRSQLKQVWGMVLCTDDVPDFLSPRQKKWSYCNLCKNFCTGKSWHDCNLFYLIFGECLTKRRSQLKQVWGMVLCTDDVPDFLSPRQKKWSYCNLCKNFCTGKSWHDCNLFYLIFGECFAFFNEMFRTLFGNMIRMSITVQSSDWLQCFTFS